VRIAIVFAALLVLVIALQVAGGAYTADLAGYDETGHYVTGLMIKMYTRSGELLHPMRFATGYYNAYPRVSLGHWPPVFYIATAAWTSIFGESRTSIIAFMAVLAATCALAVVLIWRSRIGSVAALAVAALFLQVRVVQWTESLVAPELLVTLWSLLAIWSYAAYMETERTRYSVLFGLFATAAIMTKANGFALALVPPLAIALTGRWALLRKPGFWAPAGIVAAICLPWYLLTFRAMKEGWQGSTDPKFLLGSVAVINLRDLNSHLGAAVIVAALAGIWVTVLRARRTADPLWVVSLAGLIAVYIFHTFVAPVREARHLVPAIPIAFCFAAAGVRALAGRNRIAGVCAAVAIVAGFYIQTFAVVRKPSYGASRAAAVLSEARYNAANILVASEDAIGEGAIIAETAMLQPAPSRRIVRASKLLGTSLWDGSEYRLAAPDANAVVAALESSRVSVVVLANTASLTTWPHYSLLVSTIKDNAARFRLETRAGSFEIYEFR
jgi:4-amino-4-deoxy-L-arabinose transferase-like glycosyltransferase